MTTSDVCACHSGLMYADCCRPYHEGLSPEHAVQLMRSRYSAYALHRVDYIIETTHPDHPASETPAASILSFCQQTTFYGLEIHSWTEGEKEAFVVFTAYLKQGHADVSFTERSRFCKKIGRWFYRDGTVSPCSIQRGP